MVIVYTRKQSHEIPTSYLTMISDHNLEDSNWKKIITYSTEDDRSLAKTITSELASNDHSYSMHIDNKFYLLF